MAGFSAEVLTANEAASVTRVPLKKVHRIIDAGLLLGRVEPRRGSRVIAGSGLVGLRLVWLTAETLTPTARRRIVGRAIATDATSVVVADPLKVDLKPVAAGVKIGLNRLRKAKAMVARDRAFWAASRSSPERACRFMMSPTCSPTAIRSRRSIPPIRNWPSTRSASPLTTRSLIPVVGVRR